MGEDEVYVFRFFRSDVVLWLSFLCLGWVAYLGLIEVILWVVCELSCGLD